ncbi:hydroxylamine reductase [Candidatus Contubernalis alkaliaceticus]|uniref:hydroxylamine reductase n=1 Tax=Candidatus Contubernalis alkaliaceticus TaxID=338645 RepID=UPI001F4BDBB0|nr:hydroxylamine reductase [Candidatus Contubernalis alkalaceticus]UNC92859.1 hydroxylamine reductase [Candidatus Contubernalis alkalaceticus]
MFCNQCEQTAKGTGCTVSGVCGKKPEVAALQDLLIYAVKGLSIYANEGRQKGVVNQEVNRFTTKALFTTLTNVNFDPKRFQEYINYCVELTTGIKDEISAAGGIVDFSDPASKLKPAAEMEGLIKQGEELGLPVDHGAGEDIKSLQLTTLFGIKGVAAYAHHAELLGQEDDRVYAYIHQALSAMGDRNLGLEDWVGFALKCGEVNLIAMELLDKANTVKYGQPVPTEVPLGHKKGKCILVSGHDLKDLEALLQQTEGKGINIYTHGEMLPTHGYPELKKYGHFYGHYGTAWQNQKNEFADFPGSIVMTTNCIQKPKDSYLESIFTVGTVGWPGLNHIENEDFTPAIEKALKMPGFSQDEDKGSVLVGFGHNAVLGVADKVIEAVKNGDIKHFFLVGGCDGAKPGRSYYTEFVEKAPDNTIILTLACGKFRFFDKKLGDIGGIPRLLDMGQCNDAYSAIKVATALAGAFDCGINDLPLSMVLSWYEQKACAILLTLLHLNVKNIRLGPSLPAFVTPNVLDVLVKNFNIQPIKTADEDLAELLA